MSYLLVGLGGALGAICRYSLGLLIKKKDFPLGTWIINVSGSFLLGLLFNLYLDGRMEEWALMLFGVGFCGAYTTFSTFGSETVQLLLSNRIKTALLYVGASLVVAFFAAWVGLVL